jgi:hypothetical protein
MRTLPGQRPKNRNAKAFREITHVGGGVIKVAVFGGTWSGSGYGMDTGWLAASNVRMNRNEPLFGAFRLIICASVSPTRLATMARTALGTDQRAGFDGRVHMTVISLVLF